MFGPEHGEGDPCCQIRGLRTRVRPAKLGTKETTIKNCIQKYVPPARVLASPIAVGTHRAFRARPVSERRLESFPASFARRECCRANQNRCGPQIRSLCSRALPVFSAKQRGHRAKAADHPWAMES